MDKKEIKKEDKKPGNNQDMQGVDKSPGEEQKKEEQVTKNDLKNKTVDRDMEEDGR